MICSPRFTTPISDGSELTRPARRTGREPGSGAGQDVPGGPSDPGPKDPADEKTPREDEG